MKKIFFIYLFVASLFAGCCKKDIASNTPGCIRKEISSHDKNWEVGSIDEYLFQNRTVYAFSPDGSIIADGSTAIKDNNCNTICTVGGFGGPNINLCNGENFFQSAILKRNIWKKK